MLHVRRFLRPSYLNSFKILNAGLSWKPEGLISHANNVFNKNSFGYSTIKQEEKLPSISRLLSDLEKFGRIQLSHVACIYEDIKLQHTISDDDKLMLIKCCGNLMSEELPENRLKILENIWKDLTGARSVDIRFYNALLQVYLENDYKFSPYEFITELKSKSIEPDRLTCKLMLGHFFKDGDFKGANQFAKTIFNLEFDELHSPESIIHQMKEFNLDPDAYILTSLLCNYARYNQINLIQSELKNNANSEIKLEDENILEILYTLSVNGHQKSIDCLWDSMKKSEYYNRHAVKIIHRLINREQDDIAFEIFQTMPSPSRSTEAGRFFIQHLIKTNRPIYKVIEIANKIDSIYSKSSAEFILYRLLVEKQTESAFKMLRIMQKNGEVFREHYFWPIFCSEAEKGREHLLQVIKKIKKEFNNTPTLRTIQYYIVPKLNVDDPYESIKILEQVGIQRSAVILAVLYNCILDNKLSVACDIAETNLHYIYPDIFRRPLTKCLIETGDTVNYSRFLNIICESEAVLGYKITKRVTDCRDLLGEMIIDAIVGLKHHEKRDQYLTEIFSELANGKYLLIKKQFDKIQKAYGLVLSEAHIQALHKITCGTDENVNDERRIIKQSAWSINKKAENDSNSKLSLLYTAIRENRLKQADELLKQLEAEEHSVSNELIAMLINNHALAKNPEHALHLYRKRKEQQSNFRLNGVKATSLAYALIVNQHYNDAHLVLIENQQSSIQEKNFYVQIRKNCFQILNALDERNEIDEIERFYNDFVANKFLIVDVDLLSFLLKSHLKNKNLSLAVKIFGNAVKRFQVTPSQNYLFCELIKDEDVTNLEKIVDLSISVHGEVATLCRLAIAFIVCNKPLQAKIIFEQITDEERMRHVTLALEESARLFDDKVLEGMLEVSEGMNLVDRGDIYGKLLCCYREKNSPNDIVDLCKRYCEDTVQPSAEFLHAAKTYLMSVNHAVPPNILEALSETTANDNIEEDLHLEKLISSNQLESASEFIIEKLSQKKSILRNVFKFHLGKMSAAGNLNFFKTVDNFLSYEEQLQLNYWKYYCRAAIASKQPEMFIDKCVQELEAAHTKTHLSQLQKLFPFESYSLLESNPELVDKFETMAEKFAEKFISKPFGCLWVHYFLCGQETRASEIWTKHLEVQVSIVTSLINAKILIKRDAEVLRKLLTFLETQRAPKAHLQKMYSKLIEIYTQNEQYEKAFIELKRALEYVEIDCFKKDTIDEVKIGLQKAGISFNI